MNFFERVYEVVKSVPRGKVTTYGDVARLCGNARMARQVAGRCIPILSPASYPATGSSFQTAQCVRALPSEAKRCRRPCLRMRVWKFRKIIK